jgi:hypothetical protein
MVWPIIWTWWTGYAAACLGGFFKAQGQPDLDRR